MARLFGTDGVRGVANRDLTCELAFKLGQAGAQVLTKGTEKPVIIIGRDTRISGDMLLNAMMAGICSAGAMAADVGIIPTPGIAYLTREHGADAGVVISASHNTYEFNGIKWFSRSGFKLSDEVEDRIEEIVLGKISHKLPENGDIGQNVDFPSGAEEYIQHLVDSSDVRLDGIKIVLDCANGASVPIAPEVFFRLGAEVIPCFVSPNGININDDCGSTKPKNLQKLVLEHGADVGLAFDGDADRLIAADEQGDLVDGDRIMALCARDMFQRGALEKNTLVATVMSNIGMVNSLRADGIHVEITDVGDRYVLERMLTGGYNLGGEQSGHLIFLQKNTTGDGILSALELLSVMVRKDMPLSMLAHTIEIYPQILVNVAVPEEAKLAYPKDQCIADRIRAAEAAFGKKGRVLVRTSGTEPLIRVMMEGEDSQRVQSEARAVAELIAETYGGKIQ
ncbi:MAG: phosphoglucosamine mutase [Christensenellales bacterium]|jgi:phosphoglucosamine mutase